MVEDSLQDGKRVAELLASEVSGHENEPYGRLAVTNADQDVEPTADGAHAYDVELAGDAASDDPLAEVFVQPERARLEVRSGLDAAVDAAEDGGLRTRPVGGASPRLVVFVEDGVEVKRALDVLGAAADAA
ncbi:hypothetical protein [Halobacterium zhouii]|uniref:hypothetical protein n=1 Tax=Halobacterium zhouii TaxID=2902624 RepID=UPI001E4377B3|nr:hypothetical protein [Halobacterium zhouii]